MNKYHLLPLAKTPACICDLTELEKSLDFHHQIKLKSSCKIQFALKSFSIPSILEHIKIKIDGFSASSLFEAKLAHNILNTDQSIHFTSPGLRVDEVDEITRKINYITFNSISQWIRFKNIFSKDTYCGFRINPQYAAKIDERYNPCKSHSKLGIRLNDFIDFIKNNDMPNISGLHFHTNCDSTDFNFLLNTILLLDRNIEQFLHKIKWINIGGGYLFEEAKSLDVFYEAIYFLKNKYNLDVFIEPGSSIIRNSCFLISTVIDLFKSDNMEIAILDTTINHLPEVFEYQYRHEVSNMITNGQYEYILAGSTCLAGDEFGIYQFDDPLQIGSKIVFENIGSYSTVKSNMFNGINLPTIYSLDSRNELSLIKEFDYRDFLYKYS